MNVTIHLGMYLGKCTQALALLLAVVLAFGCQTAPPAALSGLPDEPKEPNEPDACRVPQVRDPGLQAVVAALESRTIEAWLRALPRSAEEPAHPVLAATSYRAVPTGSDGGALGRRSDDIAICGLPQISVERRGGDGEEKHWLRLVEPWTGAITWHGPFGLNEAGEVEMGWESDEATEGRSDEGGGKGTEGK